MPRRVINRNSLKAHQTVIINTTPHKSRAKRTMQKPQIVHHAQHHFHIANPMLGLHAQMTNQHLPSKAHSEVTTSNISRIAQLEREVDRLSHHRPHHHPLAQAHMAKAIGSLPPTDEQVVHSLNEYDARLQNPVVESSTASIIDHNSRVEPVKGIPDAFTQAQVQHNGLLHDNLVDPFQRQQAGIRFGLSNDLQHHYPPISSLSAPATHMTEARAATQDIPPEPVQRQQFNQEASMARQAPAGYYMEADYKIRTAKAGHKKVEEGDKYLAEPSYIEEHTREIKGKSYNVKAHTREKIKHIMSGKNF